MIAELILLLTVVPTMLMRILTAFVCLCIKFCDFIIFPLMDFIMHLFGM